MEIIVKRKLFWYLLLMGANGKVIFTSETYYSKGNAIRAAKRASKILKVPVRS